jgi:hypothetical protein
MKESLVQNYGNIPLGYVHYLGIDSTLAKIVSGDMEHSGRTGCYNNDYTREVAELICKVLDVKCVSYELFHPATDYPQHFDRSVKDQYSLAVPLEYGCTFEIEGNDIGCTAYSVMGFDHTKPHRSTGPFLMITYNHEFSLDEIIGNC